MPATEYHGLERRHQKLEDALGEMEHSFAEQSQIVSKLVIISENNSNAMNKLESWVSGHEQDYRAVRERLLSQEIMGSSVLSRLDSLTAALEHVTKGYLADRNRVSGAWAAAGSAGAFVLGLVAIVKAFGII